MANIAVVFHWSPEVLDRMQVEELLHWHELAAKRAVPEKK